MTIRPLSRQEVRSIDRCAAEQYHLPTLLLMENAGRGAAAWLRDRLAPERQPPVLVLCGPGNNGGDGAVLARHLDGWGIATQVVWFLPAAGLSGDARVQLEILRAAAMPLAEVPLEAAGETALALLDQACAACGWLVDGLFGTGLTRPISGFLAQVVERMERSAKPILALDLPSGLDCDTGKPLGPTVRAAATATFIAPKLGFSQPAAAHFTGTIHVVDLGLPRAVVRQFAIS
jgi:NAD(P)H-hydrate epimerase